MKKIKTILGLSVFTTTPLLALAAGTGCGSTKNFTWLACLVVDRVVTPLISLIMVLALLYFLWGLTKYLTQTGDEKVQQQAKDAMVYGVLGMFVMFSVWGLISVLQNTFELNNSTVPVPKVSVVPVDGPC